MKAYRIMTSFWARGEGEEEEKRKKRRGEGYCRTQARRVIRSLFLSRIVGVRIYPLTLAMALAQHLVRWGERGKGGGGLVLFAVQLHCEVRPGSKRG